MGRVLIICLAVVPTIVLAVVLGGCGQRAAAPSGPDPQVLQRLQRGVNLSHAFGRDGSGAVHWNVAADDYALIRSLGLRHVRSLIELPLLLDAAGTLDSEAITVLGQAIEQANAAGLMFVLALQADEAYKRRVAADPQSRRRFVELWSALAGRLADVAPPQGLLFELLNEPAVEDPAAVQALMRALAAGVREAAPDHTLAAAGAHFSDPEDLLRLEPLADANVIYSFHFYHPHNFTHQGADWGWAMWREFHSLPYPSSPDALGPALERLSPEAHEHVLWYGEQRWNREKLAAPIRQVAAWARRHQRIAWCSEFGVYRYYVRDADRLAWLRDVRELLEGGGIAWTHWDYAGGFGLVTGDAGAREVDAGTAAALGLRPE